MQLARIFLTGAHRSNTRTTGDTSSAACPASHTSTRRQSPRRSGVPPVQSTRPLRLRRRPRPTSYTHGTESAPRPRRQVVPSQRPARPNLSTCPTPTLWTLRRLSIANPLKRSLQTGALKNFPPTGRSKCCIQSWSSRRRPASFSSP